MLESGDHQLVSLKVHGEGLLTAVLIFPSYPERLFVLIPRG